MAEAQDPRKAFDFQTHQTLTNVPGAVFPAGHQWAGLTKAQSFEAVKGGFESGPAYLASLAPAEPSAPDTGKLEAPKPKK